MCVILSDYSMGVMIKICYGKPRTTVYDTIDCAPALSSAILKLIRLNACGIGPS